MNDQIKTEILNWMKEIAASIKAGADFIGQQAPLVIQEKITLGRATETAYIIIELLMMASLPISIYVVKKYMDEGYKVLDEPGTGVPVLIAAAVAIIGLICFTCELQPFLSVWFAPRVYILQWLMDGLK